METQEILCWTILIINMVIFLLISFLKKPSWKPQKYFVIYRDVDGAVYSGIQEYTIDDLESTWYIKRKIAGDNKPTSDISLISSSKI
jgi:hypothetical protein